MRTELLVVTPDMAQRFVSHNTNNRPITQGRIDDFARIIREDKWVTSHQGIAIAPDGRLLDGQHRCYGIIKAGKAVRMNVSYDVDPESFAVMDCGKARTIADRLCLINDKTSNKVAVSLVNSYLRCTNGNSVTIDMVDDEFLTKSDAYLAMTELWRHLPKRSGLGLSAIGAALTVYVHVQASRGMDFTTRYLNGLGLKAGDPAHTLREAVLGHRLDTEHSMYWKTAAACNADSQGRLVEKLVAAQTDLYGNVYQRLAFERRAIAMKGAKTKRAMKEINDAAV